MTTATAGIDPSPTDTLWTWNRLAGFSGVAFVVLLRVIGGTWIFGGDPDSAVRVVGFVGEIGSMLWGTARCRTATANRSP